MEVMYVAMLVAMVVSGYLIGATPMSKRAELLCWAALCVLLVVSYLVGAAQ